MSTRPNLNTNLDSQVFREYYYLKAELIDFCHAHGLQATGGKVELTNRIAHFLETGEKVHTAHAAKKPQTTKNITLDTLIESNFVCSEKHRAFYKSQIGPSFSFNVAFQKWLKTHPGQTYRDSIAAYRQIIEDKKQTKAPIAKQFEYNTYIRDFFAANPDKTLAEAIQCWKYKKTQKGNHQYSKDDLRALKLT